MKSRPDSAHPPRTTAWFFWLWLVTATGASLAGNVTHALMSAPRGSAGLAAAAAAVPPVVLLGSTHSVALLIKARHDGWAHWCALLMTVSVAGCAFVLSFDALSDLAVMAGMRADRAWLWPCAIDLSIAQSTLALLSLSGLRRSESLVRTVPRARDDTAGSLDGGSAATGTVAVPVAEAMSPDGDQPPDLQHRADLASWQPAAHQLIEAGVTQKDPAVVAQILAEHAAGTPRSTISRRLDVHHSTVGRILAGVEVLE